MSLTDGDLAYLHSELGTGGDEDDWETRYERLGSVVAVAAEVIRERLATLLAGPSSFSVTGVYSESNDATIKALMPQADRLTAAVASESATATGGVRGFRMDRPR